MENNRPTKGIVVKLDIDVAKSGDWYIEHYKVGPNGLRCHIGQSLSPTKEELLKSL